MTARKVNVPSFTAVAGWNKWADYPATTVLVDGDLVTLEDGTELGRLRKGTYYYSPPTHRGSRIVRYHKTCTEWAADAVGDFNGYRGGSQGTKREALQYLISKHAERSES